ncbi:MAG: FtsH protease activity modulator HflK [Alphaproteobacteria bacterium]|nr:FtsH protease activity modulator HflK [Alphaproteobacteria bacterium]
MSSIRLPIFHNDGPWGGAPRGGDGSGRPKNSWEQGNGSDIEDIIRQGQEKFKKFSPRSGRGLVLVILAVLGLWLASGTYRVEPGQEGIELVFGKLWERTAPGLHYNYPSPIGDVLKPEVERSRRLNIGYRSFGEGTAVRDIAEESLILTGDENIVDMDFTVFYRVMDAVDFLFNMQNPERTVKIAAESAMREVVGQSAFDSVVTDGRASIEQKAATLLQTTLDNYVSGILIERVELQKSDPPSQVIDAFNDVQRARQDRDRLRNEAEAYANTIVPQARGSAEQTLREAEAYRDKLLKEAEGEASRFTQVYVEYRKSPDVTIRRMFMETVGKIMGNAEKVLLDESGSGVVPYLPLPEIGKKAQSNQ